MRRTDEAFKAEVFRRYRVQKHNRRNYFLLALSPLVLAIVLGSLIFLPQLSELLNFNSPFQSPDTPSVADNTPTLADVDKLKIDKIDFQLSGETSLRTVTDAKAIGTLIERMAKMETKVTQKPLRQERAPTIVRFSSAYYEELTMYLWKEQDYLRIDARLKGARETVTTWYQTFNLEQRILHKAVYTAAGEILPNTDHIEALLTEPIVMFSSKDSFSSKGSGDITDPTVIAEVMEIVQSLQLKPQSSGGLADVVTGWITLTLQSGRTISFTFRGSLLDVSYRTDEGKTISQTFYSDDLTTLLKVLENFKQPPSAPSDDPQHTLPNSNPLAQYIDRPVGTIYLTPLPGDPENSYACNRSKEINSILQQIGKLSLIPTGTQPPADDYDMVIQICFEDSTHIQLTLDDAGHMTAQFFTIPGEGVQQIFYYKVSAYDLKFLIFHLNFIMEGGLAEGSQHLRIESLLSSPLPSGIGVLLADGTIHRYLAPDSTMYTIINALHALNKTPVSYPDAQFKYTHQITISQSGKTLYVFYNDTRLSICFAGSEQSQVYYHVGSDEMYYFIEFVRLVTEGKIPDDLDGYLKLPVQSAELHVIPNIYYGVSNICTPAEQKQLIAALEALTLTPVTPTSPTIRKGAKIYLNLEEGGAALHLDYTTRTIELCYRSNLFNFTQQAYQIPAEEMDALAALIDKLLGSTIGAPFPPTLSDFLASSSMDKMQLSPCYQSTYTVTFGGNAAETKAVLDLLRELDLTETKYDSETSFCASRVDIQLTMERYTMDVSIDPQNGWVRTYLHNFGETYYRASPDRTAAVVSYVDKLINETAADEVWTNYLNDTLTSMGLSSLSSQSYSYSCTPDEIQQIVSALHQLTKSKCELSADRPTGAVVRFKANGNTVTLTFDPSGYMELSRVKDPMTQFDLCQGYRVPADQVEEFAILVRMMINHTPSPDTCKHEYADATCTRPRTCTICLDTQGNPRGHIFKNNLCTACGLIQSSSQGLEFELNEDGESYAVVGLGSCTDTHLVIPNRHDCLPVTRIKNAAGSHLISVTIPQGVTVIEASAFGGCYQITDVTIPDGVLTIGERAFGSCQSLTTIVLPDSITSLGSSAFEYCINLTTINIPAGLTKLKQSTFNRCYSLHSIVIPDGVTAIESWVFKECTNLKSVTIPDSVRYIDSGAFRDCTSLEEIVLPKQLTIIHSSLFSQCTNLKSVSIPDGVTTIEKMAFDGCKSLKTIKLPASLKEIGNYAFANCDSLTDLTLPDNVKYIYERAFAGCDSLTHVVLPDNVFILEYKAFANCPNLKSVIIAGSLLKMGDQVFSDCTSLEAIYCETREAHREWETDWLGGCDAKVYWKDEWTYVDGVPTAK